MTQEWSLGRHSLLASISSVQFSITVLSDSLWPHGPHNTRLPCPSPTPEVYPNSCSLSGWCHPTISSSVFSFSSCPQSFPASWSFQMSQLFALNSVQFSSVAQSCPTLRPHAKYWSFRFNVSPANKHSGLLFSRMQYWISVQSKGLSRVFSNTTVHKHQFWGAQLSLQSNSHIHAWLLEKP